MQKKLVCLIGNTKSTCNYIAHQLLGFLNDYIDINTWCVELSQQPPANYRTADIYVISNHTVYESVRTYLTQDDIILVADRIINIEYLNKLFDLDKGTKAFVVGTTEETVNNTISILHNLGIHYLEFIPYYSGMIGDAYPEVEVAITTGLAYLAPRHVKRIVDLGGKGLDLSTFAKLLAYLDVPLTVLNEISHYYLKAILDNTLQTRNMAKLTETLKNDLAFILETVDEAIIAVDVNQKIVLCNPAAEKVFALNSQHVAGKLISQVIPGVDFASCIESGEAIRQKIQRIQEHYYIVNAKITESGGMRSGVVATFHPVKEVQELETKVRRELKKKGNIAKYTFANIMGRSEGLMHAVALAKRFADTELTVLLEGESGTGKELFAQSIHNYSPRKNGPFVAVNFAAIPDNLIESELFGYEDGAFTGAKRGGRPGLFEEAHLGTIFLDEIGSASLDVQKRLLRVLEEREVRRLGSGTVIPVDVRIVAATNHQLEELVQQGLFRNDLFYRLCTLPIIIPPLRKRRGDILYLVHELAKTHCHRELLLNDELAGYLTQYRWPGNLRELQNVVKYLANMVGVNKIASIDDLPGYLLRDRQNTGRPSAQIHNTEAIELPGEFDNPEARRMLILILTEISNASRLNKGVGWQSILKQLESNIHATEYIVKSWLKKLKGRGYVETGVRRQGARITPKGLAVLNYLDRY